MLLGDRVRWSDVEATADPDEPGRALLVAVHREGRTTLLGRGEAAAVHALVEQRVAQRRAAGLDPAVGWMSVPRDGDVDPGLLDSLGLARFSGWDWMATGTPPDLAADDPRVVRLEPSAASGEIRACLRAANPGTTANPSGPDEAAWYGVRDGGALLGVFGASRRGGSTATSFSWHLHGLGVRPEARGQGLGAALTAAVTRAGLEAGAEWVSLGMYADNDVARRIYQRLGFVTEGRFASYGPPGARRPPT